ncbi:DUF4123 domain-containing protein [Schlegelella sp. S2-27]|uniref:DUF4123 domain-containing protein n=1 Tax=Caldimonas mangrovi TaxID=2944811 RepID=A0ABT0YTU5_9BURK|nr:DUF4123 domain-containing protein [Caldimonas mangrovi]MCM5682175.1 DUF4123 domain-containing protein [Caldimonas mangrovi]
MNLTDFRRQVLDTLQSAQARWAESKIFLFYAPGYDDPLGLAQPGTPPRRGTALVRWAAGAGYGEAHYPRVFELDCRRVAAYLLETDPALDDPLLEDTITRSHADLHAPAPEPDLNEGTGRAICGWLVSPDDAATIARRFTTCSQRTDPSDRQRRWLRWHDPRTMTVLWASMGHDQKTALLGNQLLWLAVDAAGHLVQFEAPAPDAAAPQPADPVERLLAQPALHVTPPQWASMHHVGLVNHLVEAWREREAEPLPRNATEKVHHLVVQADAWGLDGRDLQTFVLIALGLHGIFQQDPALVTAVRHAGLNPGTLSDHIAELPEEFWERYRQPR